MATDQPLALRRKDAELSKILKDPKQDLNNESLPLFNVLPTDSTGARCYALGGNMLFGGFPDGAVVCWAWGVEGEPEWRRSDHAIPEASPITCVSAASDGSLASGCSSGKICYQPSNAPRDAPAQTVVLPFFRGCRVIDKQRIGTVALTNLMATANDSFGASYRIRWEGEANLDEVGEDLVHAKFKHYFTISAMLLTTHQRVFGGSDDRPLVIVGTINGVLLGYIFSPYQPEKKPGPPEQVFSVSPYFQVDGLDQAEMDDANKLRKLNLDGPPITCIALSVDEEGIMLLATGRLDDESPLSSDPDMYRLDIKSQTRRGDIDTRGSQLTFLARSRIKAEKHGALATAGRTIVGSSKVAFVIADGELWCWNYVSAPRPMMKARNEGDDVSTARSLALSDDGMWLASGHADASVCVWGAFRQDCINGDAEWKPNSKLTAIHELPVQSVAFKEGPKGWIMVSAGADREVHQLHILPPRTKCPTCGSELEDTGAGEQLCKGCGAIHKEEVARFAGEKKLGCDDVEGAPESIHDTCVSNDRQLCCIALGSVIKVYNFPDICLKQEFPSPLLELKGHDDTILCMCMNRGKHGGQFLFSGSSDNTVRCWKLNSQDALSSRDGERSAADDQVLGPLVSSITSICVDRDKAKLIFVGLADGSIEIWTWQNGNKNQLERLEFHQQPVLSLSTNTGKRLVSGSADNTAVVWENKADSKKEACEFRPRPNEELKILRGHDGNVNAVYIGHRGRKIVTASTDANVLFWDLEDLAEPSALKGHQAAVTATCTSRDMQTVLSADQSGVVIEWDVISRSIRRSFHATTGQDIKIGSQDGGDADELDNRAQIVGVRSIFLVEPDMDKEPEEGNESVDTGRWLVLATQASLRVKRLDSSEYTLRKGHIHHVSCVAMSQDNTMVVSASWDGMIFLWDAIGKTQLARFKGHLGPVFCCDISDDNAYILSGSADTNIIVWDRQHAGRKKVLQGYHDDPVECLKMVPAAPSEYLRFATGSMDHKVNLFGMGNEEDAEPRLLSFIRHRIGISCVIGPRSLGGAIGIGACDGTLVLWTPKVVELDDSPAKLMTSQSTISQDSKFENRAEDETVELKYHASSISSVHFTHDAEMLLSTSMDGEASVWKKLNPASMRMTMAKTFTHPGNPPVTVGRFSEQRDAKDTLLVALGCEDKAIYIWDYRAHVIEKILTGHTAAICDLEISRDSKLLISAARESRILRWNMIRGTADFQLRGHADGVVVIEVSDASQRVVSGAKDNRIIVWNTVGPSAGKPQLDLLLHSGNVSCLALSRDGSRLLSGSWDTTVCLTDLQTPQVIRKFRGHVGAVLGCMIGGDAEDIIVSCCRAGRLIRWNMADGKPKWNASLGGPARCLAFRQDTGLIFVGCDKENAIQVWDSNGTLPEPMKILKAHDSVVTSLAFGFEGRLLISSDIGGHLAFWDSESSRQDFEQKGNLFTSKLLKEGVESIAVHDEFLVLSTGAGHVALYELDVAAGIMQGATPIRVWKHHKDRARVRCVKFLSPECGPLKVVSASYDGRILIHPVKEGTSLWFSWRPIMNAARSQDYTLFRYLLLNQRCIFQEKVYPVGWTLLHALTDLGDLQAIQELLKIAGSDPLGFTQDAELRTPLDIGLETVQTGILDTLLYEAKAWPRHVLEASTKSICALVPMSLSSMPNFLDSRIFEPMAWALTIPPPHAPPHDPNSNEAPPPPPPRDAEHAPTETLMSDSFNAIGETLEYFEAVGMGGSQVPSMSFLNYARAGIAVSLEEIAEMELDDEEEFLRTMAGSYALQIALQKFLSGKFWTLIMMMVVLGDFILTLVSMFVKDVDENDQRVQLVGFISTLWFLVDIVLRILASGSKFFFGPDRYMNMFELTISVVCIVLEVAESTFPVSFGRILRPVMRSVKLARGYGKVAWSSLTGLAGSGKLNSGTVPISVKCAFLSQVMDHQDGILRHLVNSKQAELFRSTTVRAIVEFKWQRYAKAHHVRNFSIFLLYSFCWLSYTSIAYMHARDTVDILYKDLLSAVILGFTLRYLSHEAAKLYIRGFIDYTSSGWNVLNVVTSACVVINTVYELVDRHDAKARRLASAVTPFVWIQSFNYLRGFRGTGALVRMIIQIVLDIKFFLLIMFIMTIAFTQAFFILEDEEIGPLDQPHELAWLVYNTAWLGAQWEDYSGPVLPRAIYCFMTFFQLVVLMNLLIAIMGDTFNRVMAGATVEFYRNLAQLIYELEVLMTPNEHRLTSHFPNYLLFSTKTEASEEGNEGGQAERGPNLQSIIQLIDQSKSDLKGVTRTTSKVADRVEKLAGIQGGGPAPTQQRGGAGGSPRQHFHV